MNYQQIKEAARKYVEVNSDYEREALDILFGCIEEYGMEDDVTESVNAGAPSDNIVKKLCDAAWEWDVFPVELVKDY